MRVPVWPNPSEGVSGSCEKGFYVLGQTDTLTPVCFEVPPNQSQRRAGWSPIPRVPPELLFHQKVISGLPRFRSVRLPTLPLSGLRRLPVTSAGHRRRPALLPPSRDPFLFTSFTLLSLWRPVQHLSERSLFLQKNFKNHVYLLF